MRIIAGNLKGRIFQEPRGHRTHPMSEKIRGALFNTLGDIDGLSFLDAFAGSGGLSFEAASRGAKSVIAIEKDNSAYNVLTQSIRDLGLDRIIHATKANVSSWSDNNINTKFDILLLDPPYDNLQIKTLEKLTNRHIIDGLAVVSQPGGRKPIQFKNTVIIMNKNYGDAQLVFYKKSK